MPTPPLPPLARIEQPAGPDLLPPLDLQELDDWRQRVYRSYETFLVHELNKLDQQRPSLWQRDYRSLERYLASIEPMRQRLRDMFGWWVEPQRRADLDIQDTHTLFEDDTLIARRLSLQVLGGDPGLRTYAVEMFDKTRPPVAGLLAQHGYAGSPEAIIGFGPGANADDHSYRSLGLRAARHGFHVVAVHHPTSFGQPQRMATFPLPGHEPLGYTYGKNRLHRLATLAAKTLFGLDLMASSRGIDLLIARGFEPRHIGMYGLSQGGQTALYLPAVDPRVNASVAACYFNHRLSKLIGPIRGTAFLQTPIEDKFFREVVGVFADSDVVSLIAPRAFAVEAGSRDSAVDLERAWPEFCLAREHYHRLNRPEQIAFIAHEQGHVSATAEAMTFLLARLQKQ